MKFEYLESDCKCFYLVNVTFRENGYVRAGALVCVETTQPVATFTLSDQKVKLLIPGECLDSASITKTFNLDLPVLP